MNARNQVQTNVIGGQISPLAGGRYDWPLFKFGLEKGLNVICTPQGGFMRRPGTIGLYQALPSSRMIAFRVAPTESYQLVFQPGGTLRILDDGTLLTTITTNLPGGAVVLRDMSYVAVRDLFFIAHRRFFPKVLRATKTTTHTGNGTLDKFDTEFPYFDSANIIVKKNGVVQTLGSAYTLIQPARIGGQYSSALVDFTTAPANGDTIEIIRDWEFVDYPAEDGPWLQENEDPNYKIRVSNLSGGTIDDSAATPDVTNYWGPMVLTTHGRNRKSTSAWFNEAWIGRQIRIFQKTNSGIERWGIGTITSKVSAAEYRVTIDEDYPLVRQTTDPINTYRRWRLNAWYDDNYPDIVGFNENRMWFARDNDRWASVTGNLFAMSPDTITGLDDAETYVVTDSAAIYMSQAGAKSTNPKWFAPDQVLHIGTDAGHSIISAAGSGGISSTNIKEEPQSSAGACFIPPVVLSSEVYYVDNFRQNVYKTSYKFQQSRFIGEKVNVSDQNLLYPRVRSMALTMQPWSMLWCCLDNGEVAVCTVNELDSLYSWTILEFSEEIWDVVVAQKDTDREKVYLLGAGGKVYRLGAFNTDLYRSITYLEDDIYTTNYYHSYNFVKPQEYVTDDVTVYPAGSINTNTIPSNKTLVEYGTYKNLTRTTFSDTQTLDIYEIGTPFSIEVITNPLNITVYQESNITKRKHLTEILFSLYKSTDFQVRVKNAAYIAKLNLRSIANDPDEGVGTFTGLYSLKAAFPAVKNMQLIISQEWQTPLSINSFAFDYEEK